MILIQLKNYKYMILNNQLKNKRLISLTIFKIFIFKKKNLIVIRNYNEN